MLMPVSLLVNFAKVESINNLLAQYYRQFQHNGYVSAFEHVSIYDKYLAGVAREMIMYNTSRMERYKTNRRKNFTLRYKPSYIFALTEILKCSKVAKGEYETALINTLTQQILKQNI